MAERKKPAELPGYVKAKDVAELLDITIQRVGQLRKEGIITQYKTPAGDRYQIVETVKAYIRYLRSQTTGKTTNEWEEKKVKAEAEFKEAKAAIAMMQRDELVGQMHRSEDVEAVLTDLAAEIRSLIMALPGRLAIDTARIKTPEEESIRIREECYEILSALASYQYDPEVFRRRVKERKGAEIIDEDE